MNMLRYRILALGVIFTAFSTIASRAQISTPDKTRTIEVSGACLSQRPMPLHTQMAPDKFEPLGWGSLMFAASRKVHIVDDEFLLYLKSEKLDPESKATTVHYNEAIRLKIPENIPKVLILLWTGQAGLEGRVIDADKAAFPMESFYVLNACSGLLGVRISDSAINLQPGEARVLQGKGDFSSNDGPVNKDAETGTAVYTKTFAAPVAMSSVLVSVKRPDEGWHRPLKMRWMITPNRRQVVFFHFDQKNNFTFNRIMDQQ